MGKLKFRLVDGWKKSWKWLSVQALALGTAVNGAWVLVPDELKASMPPKVAAYASLVIFATGFAARFLTTAPKAEEPGDSGADAA